MSELKPIETVYSGYRFRSRLEARWAVFFDELGIDYVYEPEGYDLGALGWYLPDFWLPQVEMWAEIKPKEFTEIEAGKCRELALGTGYSCLMLDGLPAERNYWAFQGWFYDEDDPELMDYILSEGSQYWKTEGRFFSCTGCEPWRVIDVSEQSSGEDAVAAARQARFEHGERA